MFKARKEEFRLPKGGSTYDVKKYIKAWRDLAKPICEATGSVLHALDPDIQIRFGDRKQGKITRMGKVITLPTDFLEKLNQKLK